MLDMWVMVQVEQAMVQVEQAMVQVEQVMAQAEQVMVQVVAQAEQVMMQVGEVSDGPAAIGSATQQHHQPAPARAAQNGDLSPADLDNGTGELGMQPPAGGSFDQNHVVTVGTSGAACGTQDQPATRKM